MSLAVDWTWKSNKPPSMVGIETSNVPPLKSNIKMLFSCLSSSRRARTPQLRLLARWFFWGRLIRRSHLRLWLPDVESHWSTLTIASGTVHRDTPLLRQQHQADVFRLNFFISFSLPPSLMTLNGQCLMSNWIFGSSNFRICGQSNQINV